MKKISDFLRKAGLMQVSKGDYQTGDFDSRSDLKEEPIVTKEEPVAQNENAIIPQAAEGGTVVRTITFWVAVVLALFFLLAAFGTGGGYLVAMFVIWVALLLFLKKWAFGGMYTTALGVVLVILIVFVSLLSVPSDGENRSSSTAIVECEAVNLKAKNDERIEVTIVGTDDAQTDLTKETYSFSELDGLQYGYTAQETSEGFYVSYELCAGGKTLSFADLEAESWNYKENTTIGAKSWSGNHTHFVNEQDDGSISSDIEEPGDYVLYAYISHDGEKWYVAQEHEFEVN